MSIIHDLSKGIILNTEQQKFVSLVAQGRSCCLVGAAGTGKTTAVKQAITTLLSTKAIPTIKVPTGNPANPKLLQGLEGIVGCAFTRKAVANLKANFPDRLHPHCMTIHALLEFAPVTYDSINSEGNLVSTMRFEPQRNKLNPLPTELTTIVIEESSMVGTDLFKQLMDAINHPIQLVFLGDINQLSPVFGDAILGYKLLELPTIVLTQVYRQALESPIIRLAHRILSGKQILYPELSKEEKDGGQWQVKDKLSILNWKPKTSEVQAEITALAFLRKEYLAGNYDPFNDMVICPFNKHFGTINLSKGIANFIDERYSIHPTEVISGFVKKYFAIGDLVLYKNDEYIITKINKNAMYRSKLQPNTDVIFDRFGNIKGTKKGKDSTDAYDTSSIPKTADEIINSIIANAEDEVTDNASHVIYLTKPEAVEKYLQEVLTMEQISSGAMKDYINNFQGADKSFSETISIDSRGQVNNLTLAYATTCHKAQGLESKRVFILTHKCHNILLNREWLYTAVTRAKETLTILCERDAFIGGINKQQIKGTTLEEKAEYFKGKQLNKASLVA